MMKYCVALLFQKQGIESWKNQQQSFVSSYPELWLKTVLQWRHNGHGGVSNNQPHDCLLNDLFRRRLKKTSKLRVTGLCEGNSPLTGDSPHKGPVTRKMFSFDNVIMRANLPLWI